MDLGLIYHTCNNVSIFIRETFRNLNCMPYLITFVFRLQSEWTFIQPRDLMQPAYKNRRTSRTSEKSQTKILLSHKRHTSLEKDMLEQCKTFDDKARSNHAVWAQTLSSFRRVCSKHLSFLFISSRYLLSVFSSLRCDICSGPCDYICY